MRTLGCTAPLTTPHLGASLFVLFESERLYVKKAIILSSFCCLSACTIYVTPFSPFSVVLQDWLSGTVAQIACALSFLVAVWFFMFDDRRGLVILFGLPALALFICIIIGRAVLVR
jgi:hypothetical protein